MPGVVETHLSVVVPLGDRVYKFKKPVTFPFVDLSRRTLRARMCQREVDLNRRLAPDVYLGVGQIVVGDRGPDEPVVVMRRLPDDRRLELLVTQGASVDRDLERVARAMARLHAESPRLPEIDTSATRDAVARNWEANFTEMEPFVGKQLDRAHATEVQRRARQYLDGREPLFKRRIDEGHIRDGHGDLRSDDIFCLKDGPRILDCIEFDDRLRFGDVLGDVAFLAMDLERLGQPALATRFLDAYRQASGASWPDSLAHQYIAYRAQVRAKVACLRPAVNDEELSPTVEHPARLLELAAAHLRRAQVVLVVVGGAPGTGKSTLAGALSQRLGWSLLQSDVVRKDLAPTTGERPGPSPRDKGLYRPDITARTYRRLLDAAEESLSLGTSVIADASWRDPRWRQEVRAMANRTSTVLVELQCRLPPSEAARRVAGRVGDPSDATPDLATELGAEFPRWRTATPIDTRGTSERSVAQALPAIQRACRA